MTVNEAQVRFHLKSVPDVTVVFRKKKYGIEKRRGNQLKKSILGTFMPGGETASEKV